MKTPLHAEISIEGSRNDATKPENLYYTGVLRLVLPKLEDQPQDYEMSFTYWPHKPAQACEAALWHALSLVGSNGVIWISTVEEDQEEATAPVGTEGRSEMLQLIHPAIVAAIQAAYQVWEVDASEATTLLVASEESNAF